MARSITAVWFDLDDTLFDHTYSVCRGMDAVRAAYPGLQVRSSQELAALYNRVLNALYVGYLGGKITFEEMRCRKLKLFYESAGVNEHGAPSLSEFHAVYDEAYRKHRRATPGSREVLSELKGRETPLAILTNGKQDIQEDKLKIIGLEWMISNLLTSEKAGATKPDPKIYSWALARTKQTAGNVLMVGDSLENDVEAALRCGLSAAQYAPGANSPTVSTTYGTAPVVREWNELLGLIDDAMRFN